jgi:transcriptional regulator with XRE-family HTH domain
MPTAWALPYRCRRGLCYDGLYTGIHDLRGEQQPTMGAPGKNEEQAQFIGAKVDHLFRTITQPNGKPYTYKQVAAGTGLNFSYLRKLRVGKVASPSRGVLERLTTFFGVTPDYWFRSVVTVPHIRMTCASPPRRPRSSFARRCTFRWRGARPRGRASYGGASDLRNPTRPVKRLRI